MNLKKLALFMFIVSVIIFSNVVSASDLSSEDTYQTISDCVEVNTNAANIVSTSESNTGDAEIRENCENIAHLGEYIQEDSPDIPVGSSDNNVTVYVGTNSTPNGQGTEDDPYANLTLACDKANEDGEKSKITVNIKDGTYYLPETLRFNTQDLYINGLGNSVIIKNVYNNTKQSFASKSKFTMSNVIFNASDFTGRHNYDEWFTPFVIDNYYNDAEVIFNNCTFADYDDDNVLAYSAQDYVFINVNFTFNNCKFVSSANGTFKSIQQGVPDDGNCKWNVKFNYCLFCSQFKTIGFDKMGFGGDLKLNISFDSCWLGNNNMYTNAFYLMDRADFKSYPKDFVKIAEFDRHAILDVSENYLGSNKYEIIGALIWNDTKTSEDISKLGSMTVYLKADNGVIPEIATLENGTFKVDYISDNSNHMITVILDQQVIKLNNNIIFSVNNETINSGNNLNITLNFQNDVNGTAYVMINNQTYKKWCPDKNSVDVPINNTLNKGTYDFNVTFVNKNNEVIKFDYPYYSVEEENSYGFNNGIVKVNGKSDYDFDANLPSSVFVGGNATVTLSLPSEITSGNVTIKIGDNDVGTFDIADNIVISGFTAGENIVNITYNGNDIYEAKSIEKNVVASEEPSISIPEIKAGEATTTTVKIADDATGNITVSVDGEEKSVSNLTNGAATITIPALSAGNHNVTITYSGDENYGGFSKSTNVDVKEPAKPTPTPDTGNSTSGSSSSSSQVQPGSQSSVKKQATKIVAKKKTFKAKKKVKKYTVTLKTKAGKAIKKAKLSLKIGKKTFKATTNKKGKATFKIKKLTKKGKYKAIIKYAGNKTYKASKKTVKITIKK